MKIIKRGTPPEDKKIRWTCKHCGSILEAKQSEGRTVHDRDGTMIEFTCPVCERKGWGYP
jgi:RNase P subunit RPR2